jgi:hypothetical protein
LEPGRESVAGGAGLGPSHPSSECFEQEGQLSETVALGSCNNSGEYILARLAIFYLVSSRGGLLSATFAGTGHGAAMHSAMMLAGLPIITR